MKFKFSIFLLIILSLIFVGGCGSKGSNTSDNSNFTTIDYTYGNLSNFGNLTYNGKESYLGIKEFSNNTYNINFYKSEDNSNYELIYSQPANEESTVSYLNYYNNKIYVLLNEEIYELDLESKNLSSTGIHCIGEFVIYSDRIIMYTSDGYKIGFSSCKLDGSDLKPIYMVESNLLVENFVIIDDYLYYQPTASSAYETWIERVPLSGGPSTEFYRKMNQALYTLVVIDGEIYFNASPEGMEITLDDFDNSIYKLDMNTREASVAAKYNGPVSQFNSDGSYFYYIIDSNLYRSDLDGKNEIAIGSIPTTENSVFEQRVFVNNTSVNVLKIDKIDQYDAYLNTTINAGIFNNMLTAPYTDPEDFKYVNFSADGLNESEGSKENPVNTNQEDQALKEDTAATLKKGVYSYSNGIFTSKLMVDTGYANEGEVYLGFWHNENASDEDFLIPMTTSTKLPYSVTEDGLRSQNTKYSITIKSDGTDALEISVKPSSPTNWWAVDAVGSQDFTGRYTYTDEEF